MIREPLSAEKQKEMMLRMSNNYLLLTYRKLIQDSTIHHCYITKFGLSEGSDMYHRLKNMEDVGFDTFSFSLKEVEKELFLRLIPREVIKLTIK